MKGQLGFSFFNLKILKIEILSSIKEIFEKNPFQSCLSDEKEIDVWIKQDQFLIIDIWDTVG